MKNKCKTIFYEKVHHEMITIKDTLYNERTQTTLQHMLELQGEILRFMSWLFTQFSLSYIIFLKFYSLLL